MAYTLEKLTIDPRTVTVAGEPNGPRGLAINGREVGELVACDCHHDTKGALRIEIEGAPGQEFLIMPTPCAKSWLMHLGGYPPIPQAIECPGCDGEGGDEGPTTCGHGCDWCGGCRDQPQECGQCEGAQEVPLYAEECHATDDLLHCSHWGDGDDEAGTCCHCGAKP